MCCCPLLSLSALSVIDIIRPLLNRTVTSWMMCHCHVSCVLARCDLLCHVRLLLHLMIAGTEASKPPLTIGSDCSGVGTDAIALSRLGIQFRNLFSSDIDRHCRELLQ